MLTHCPFCNAPHPAFVKAKFCGKCGKKQPQPADTPGEAEIRRQARARRKRRVPAAQRPTTRLGRPMQAEPGLDAPPVQPRPPEAKLEADPMGEVPTGVFDTPPRRAPTVRIDPRAEPDDDEPTGLRHVDDDEPTGLREVDDDQPTGQRRYDDDEPTGLREIDDDSPTGQRDVDDDAPTGQRISHPGIAKSNTIVMPVVQPAPAPRADAAPVDLGSDESAVLLHFDDEKSLDEMSSATGLPSQRVHQIVRRLRHIGLLSQAPKPAPVTPPVAAPPDSGPGPGPMSASEMIARMAAQAQAAGPPSAPPASVSPATERGAATDAFLAGNTETTTDEIPSAVRNVDELMPLSDDDLGGSDVENTTVDPVNGSDNLDDPTYVDDDFAVPVDAAKHAAKPAEPPPPEERAKADVAKNEAGTEDVETTTVSTPEGMAPESSKEPESKPDALPADIAADVEKIVKDASKTDISLATAMAVAKASVEESASEATLPDQDAGPLPSDAPPPPEDAKKPTEKDDEKPDEKGDDEPVTAADELNFRKVYETEFHPLPEDQRIELASKLPTKKLLAMCYDPSSKVIKAIFENAQAGLAHARMVATHHRSGAGLDIICTRGDFNRDPQVQRKVLRNPMLPENALRRILMAKRLPEIYKFTNDRDVPDRSRASSRGILKRRFSTAQPEERVELIWQTEGRCLMALSGCNLDSKTTAMLCGRNIASVMLIQSFARFPATPPSLVAHILKQPMVKRQKHLRNMLIKHPNCPADAKRRL